MATNFNNTIPAGVNASGVLPIGLTLGINNTGNNAAIVLSNEIKGGVHEVEYLQWLNENSYRGVSIARRQVGMLAYVHKSYIPSTADTATDFYGVDEEIKSYYRLVSLDGNLNGTWEKVNFEANTIGLGRTFTADTYSYIISAVTSGSSIYSNFTPPIGDGDVFIVKNASDDFTETPALTGSATYIRYNNNYFRFKFPDDPRLANSHAQNTDTQLKVVSGTTVTFITALSIDAHINDIDAHRKIGDSGITSGTTTITGLTSSGTTFSTELYKLLGGSSIDLISTAKVVELLNNYFVPKSTKTSNNKFLSEDGHYREVQGGRGGNIDGGNASSVFPA